MKVLYHHVSSEDEVPNVGTSLAQKTFEGAKEISEDGRRRDGFKVGESVGEDEVPSVSKIVGEEIKKKAGDQDKDPRYQEQVIQGQVAKYRSSGKLVQNHQRESLKQEVQSTDVYKKATASRKEEEPYLPDGIEPEQVKEKEVVDNLPEKGHILFFHTMGSRSHLIAMSALAEGLVQHGHKVTTVFYAKSNIVHENYKEILIEDK